MIRAWRILTLLQALVVATACGSGGGSPSPSPPGGSVGETITGRERIGWDQQAASAGQLATLRYAIYVDGTRSQLTDVTCASTAGAAGFPCSARLPALSNGAHTLEIVSFIDANGVVESARSEPLRVNVTGATAPVEPTPLADGEIVTTIDGAALVVERVTGEVKDATDLAIAGDGRIFFTDTTGRLRVADGNEVHDLLHLPETAAAGGLLGLALAPEFTTSGHVYVVAAFASESGNVFRVLRVRLEGGRALDRVVLIPDVAASQRPRATIRFGPDRKLYAGFDTADDDERATRLSDWSGKLLRLEPDGRTPEDQPAASPVLWNGIRVPRGMDWMADGTLWAAEEGTDAVERVRAITATADDGVRRAKGRASYLLPKPFDGRSVAAYRGPAVGPFANDLFLAGGDAGYLLRVSFDRDDSGRAVSTERLFDGRLQSVRAVTASRDGALYFCTADTLWRLRSSER